MQGEWEWHVIAKLRFSLIVILRHSRYELNSIHYLKLENGINYYLELFISLLHLCIFLS